MCGWWLLSSKKLPKNLWEATWRARAKTKRGHAGDEHTCPQFSKRLEKRVNDIALQSNFTVGYPVRKTIPRDIMGEAPRARITAQNTLTTWHADRLYGAMVLVLFLNIVVNASSQYY